MNIKNCTHWAVTALVLCSVLNVHSQDVLQEVLPKEEAVRLIVFVLSHPASAQHSLFGHRDLQEEAELLRKELEAALTPEVYESALSSDPTLDLEVVVGNLLQPENR